MKLAFLFCAVLTQFVYAGGINNNNVIKNILDRNANEQFHDKFLEYKQKQNNMPDNERVRQLFDNQYWLVNKSQNLWMGIFNGKMIKISPDVYSDIPQGGFLPEQVIRIKKNNTLSQFLLTDDSNSMPLYCHFKNDGILKDSSDYMVFYSGCGNKKQAGTQKYEIFYDIFFYSKIYDTLIKLDSFPDSALQGYKIEKMSDFLEKKQGYFTIKSIDSAFKIVDKDKVIVIDINTGKPQEKTPELNVDGEPILDNGKPVMVDDPDGFHVNILKRVPN